MSRNDITFSKGDLVGLNRVTIRTQLHRTTFREQQSTGVRDHFIAEGKQCPLHHDRVLSFT